MTDATVIGNKVRIVAHHERTTADHQGNLLFHVDSSFNARRAGHSLLMAHKLPPAGTGGATEVCLPPLSCALALMTQFSDSRTAYDDLSDEMKAKLDGVVANHSLFHSRKTAMPEYFKDMDVTKMPMSKHQLVQKHESSGRMVCSCLPIRLTVADDQNLYIASYVHHLDGMPKEESDRILKELTEHIYKDKYRQIIPWEQEGDLIIWDK